MSSLCLLLHPYMAFQPYLSQAVDNEPEETSRRKGGLTEVDLRQCDFKVRMKFDVPNGGRRGPLRVN